MLDMKALKQRKVTDRVNDCEHISFIQEWLRKGNMVKRKNCANCLKAS